MQINSFSQNRPIQKTNSPAFGTKFEDKTSDSLKRLFNIGYLSLDTLRNVEKIMNDGQDGKLMFENTRIKLVLPNDKEILDILAIDTKNKNSEIKKAYDNLKKVYSSEPLINHSSWTCCGGVNVRDEKTKIYGSSERYTTYTVRPHDLEKVLDPERIKSAQVNVQKALEEYKKALENDEFTNIMNRIF